MIDIQYMLAHVPIYSSIDAFLIAFAIALWFGRLLHKP